MNKQILLVACLFVAQLTFAQESISLFNGENLDGWINHGEEKWYVEDGELICESGPKGEYGYLSTEKFTRILS